MIANRALMVTLDFSMYEGYKHDREVSREVEENHNGRGKSGRYNKHLLKPQIAELRALRTLIRGYHYQMTLPWTDRNERLLPSTLYFEYVEKMGELKEKFLKKVEEFISNYEEYKRQELEGQDLFKEEDYPSETELRSKFDMRVLFKPVPQSGDFRVEMAEEAMEELRRDLDEAQKKSLTDISKDIWIRLDGVVGNLYNNLLSEDQRYKSASFRNIAELVRIVGKLNVNEDEEITAIKERIERDLISDPEDAEKITKRSKKDILFKGKLLKDIHEIIIKIRENT